MAGVKGKSGRQKGEPIVTEALRRAMLRAAQDKGHKNRLHAMAEKVAKEAEQGERWAVEYVTDRLEGKATQTHAHGAAEDLPPIDAIQVTFVRSDATDV